MIEEVIETPVDSKQVYVIDFYADWCGHCRSIEPALKEAADKNTGLKFLRMNVDRISQEYIDKYNIDELPVVIVFKNGQELARWNEDHCTLESWLAEAVF